MKGIQLFITFVRILFTFIIALFILLMAFFITHRAIGFFDLSQPHPFLETKEPYFPVYLPALYGHIITSSLILILGLVAMLRFVRKRWVHIHRWVGKIYIGLILLISAPCGFVMALYARGGLELKWCFGLLAVCWWLFTYFAYRAIRKGAIKQHQFWMWCSYALTFSAINLRWYHVGLMIFMKMHPYSAYVWAAWGSWVGNLVLVLVFWGAFQFLEAKRLAVHTEDFKN